MNDENERHFLLAITLIFALMLAMVAIFCGGDAMRKLSGWGKLGVILLFILGIICVLFISEIIPSGFLFKAEETYTTPILSQKNLYNFELLDWNYGRLADESVLFIPEQHFEGKEQLRKIKFYGNTTVIGAKAFFGCKKLQKIELPKKIEYIGNFTFEGCESLSEIILPDTIETIGKSAFKDCKSLKKLTIPPLLSEIDEETFSDCTKLEKVDFGEAKITKISESAFEGCESLSELSLPDTIETIGKSAFKDCKSLKKLTVTVLLTEIDEETFSDCTKLEKVDFGEAKITKISESAFEGCERNNRGGSDNHRRICVL